MLSGLRHLLTRIGPWPRRVLALFCLAMAASTALGARAPAAARGDTVQVVVAARDLPAGHRIVLADLRVSTWPAADRPAHAVTAAATVVGRVLAGPLGRGDPLTPHRLLGDDLTAGLAAGTVATALALDDRHAADLVHAGAHVDVIGTPSDRSTAAATGDEVPPGASDRAAADNAETLARDVLVLAVLPGTPDDPGVEVVIATDRATASRLAARKVTTTFALVGQGP